MPFQDWRHGNAPAQIRWQDWAVAHPVRSSLAIGTGWGLVMTAMFHRTLIGLVIGLVLGNVMMGPMLGWWTPLQAQRRRRGTSGVPSDHA